MNPSKKPQQRATTRRTPRLPVIEVRRQIWEAACDLIATGEPRELSAVLSRKFDLPERSIDFVLVLEGMRHERIAATLRTGIVSALESAKDAAATVDNVSDAA